MASILLWTGIVLTVLGWIVLAWQAAKRMAVKAEQEGLTNRRGEIRLRRNYCWMTILVGVILILIAMII